MFLLRIMSSAYANIWIFVLFNMFSVLMSLTVSVSLTSSMVQHNIRLNIVDDNSERFGLTVLFHYGFEQSHNYYSNQLFWNFTFPKFWKDNHPINICFKSIKIICKTVLCSKRFSMDCLRERISSTVNLPGLKPQDIQDGLSPHSLWVFRSQSSQIFWR